MEGTILLSTAYLAPVEYFARISGVEEILIEREENYRKQTYRNRCYILSSDGPQTLSVPIYLGSFHKTLLKDIRIDYSKRWQQVHLRALTAAYSSSPYFQYYFENLERIILGNHEFLLDLNMDLLKALLNILKINKILNYTSDFKPDSALENDYRYKITPKKKSDYAVKEYLQVFNTKTGFVRELSIVDMIFNVGPDSGRYL